ncbi:MAG: response regulator [Deltaproteobacteria bacterium]|nr:response regulator [Deltaproteobacteria bacterium]
MAKILLIDDDPQILDLLQDVLTEDGHECCCAANGAIGFKALEESPFDLVVTDLIMPVAEGLETIMKIRSYGNRVPILAISGGIPWMPTDFLPMAQRLGADRTLAKPLEIQKFKQLVRELLGGQSGA